LRRVSENAVIFRRLLPADIDFYVASGEGIGKAGGYSLQGCAQKFIRFMSGSPSGVIGLPIFDVNQMLITAGWPTHE
jgi:septum formation protein